MPATFGLVLIAVLALGSPALAQLLPPPPPPPTVPTLPPPPPEPVLSKLDPLLLGRVSHVVERSRVIVRASDSASIESVATLIQQAGGIPGRQLPIIRAMVADVPDAALGGLTASALVRRIALDRSIRGTMNRTSATIRADAVRQELGYDGTGVGVAVIDSGVTSWHDDLTSTADGGQRIDAFVDFVQGHSTPYDDFGHGTHVAGIIAGNGFDSGGARAGIAPGARLVVLKVLDDAGHGRISDVIAAIGYAVDHKDAFRIRIINLSIGAGVFESYASDMLTIAAKGAVDAGILVVASAGNFGKDANGRAKYGGITAPGNAPWVFTVGASSHMGTVDRGDDTVAGFSSRGPTAIDRAAKPDLVAPGVGTESLADPSSALFTQKPHLLLNGTVPTAFAPYLSLSGTSQAAPVIAGVAALMLQANPSLTPNAIKAILQFTARPDTRYDALTEGAGFVDARAAVELARFLGAPALYLYPPSAWEWSRQVIWGNYRISPDELAGGANAWRTDVIWGAVSTSSGQSITWGSGCQDVACATLVSADSQVVSIGGSSLVVTTSTATVTVVSDNVVWGSACGGANCTTAAWSPAMVGSTSDDGDTVVWGSSDDGDTVVWGSSSDDGDTVVWGSSSTDEVVWDRNPEAPAAPEN